jgi:hypothetical protein
MAMSRGTLIVTALAGAIAHGCSVEAGDGSTSLGADAGETAIASDEGATAVATDPGADADDGGDPSGSDGPAGSGDTAPAEESSGEPDPTTAGDDGEPHGEGNCGGGFGDPNGLGHIPPCPSDPVTFHQRYLATRADYYHDGDHVFEPKVVEWDDEIAAVAQEYAEAYAAGMAPVGSIVDTPIDEYEPYWEGTYQGYRAITGSETPTSCTCSRPDFFGGSEAMVFYNNSSAYFREGVVRMNEVYRMGIGHVAPGDGSHYWTFLFAEN